MRHRDPFRVSRGWHRLEHVLDTLADEQTRLVLAQLHGALMYHARFEPLSPAAMAAAVADIKAILAEAGRDDGPALLAQVAGILTGTQFGWPPALQRAVVAGSICVAAGADEFLIDGWTTIGYERTGAAEADRRMQRAAL
jgi:hypothetical protein